MKNRITIAFQDTPENKLLYEAAAKAADIGLGEWYRNALMKAVGSGIATLIRDVENRDFPISPTTPLVSHSQECWYRRHKQSCPE